MPYQAKFNDTSNINKPFYQAILEGVYVGKIFNLEIKDYPIHKIIKNLFLYTFSNPNLPTLTETQIRKVEDYIIVQDSLIKFYQLQIPYVANSSELEQTKVFNDFSRLIENIQMFSSIELFYYDRPELINDYSSYFNSLTQKINENNKYLTNDGKELSLRLEANMEPYLLEMFEEYKSRSREAFMVIYTKIEGKSTDDLITTKKTLDTKVNKILSALKEIRINNQVVAGDHLDWLLNNFVSNTTNY